MLNHAEGAEEARDNFARAGVDIPDHLWPPDILPGAEEWLAAFWELSSDRHINMTAGPIPAASIRAHTAGWDDDEAEMFRQVIRTLDRVFLRETAPSKDGKPKVKASAPLTPDAFAGMFGR